MNALAMLAELGHVVERVLQNPKTDANSWGVILGKPHDLDGPPLYQVWQSFCPADWTVDQLIGSVHRRIEKTADEKQQELEWGWIPTPDNLKWKARALLIMRTREKSEPCPYINSDEPREPDYIYKAQVASLLGESLEGVLTAFTGRTFTPDETAQFYQVAELRARRVENWADSPLKRTILGAKV